LFENFNKATQPLAEMPIFNNWKVVTESWYCVGTLASLKEKKIISAQIGKQKLVIFRTDSDRVHCLDAFCAHLGLNLATGTVEGEKLQCQFHHWRYDGEGEVTTPTCKKLSDARKLNSYPVELRYGLIWVWAGKNAKYPLPFHPDLAEGSFSYRVGKAYTRPSHPHISLLNALDTSHVNTVHALDLTVTGSGHESEDQQLIHFDFEGNFRKDSKKGKRAILFTGGHYKYSVRYIGGTLGFLKALDGIKLLSRFKTRPMYAAFSYCPLDENTTVIRPIFLTPKGKGILGMISAHLYLLISQIIYNRLKNEDGEIYENIRFTPHFQAEDKLIINFIAHVNRLPKANL
jgi:phenylpropionate dioxygenase-like ring-hydroxylating dioxygenase large terminal subunit